jgi:hypothetical protein
MFRVTATNQAEISMTEQVTMTLNEVHALALSVCLTHA